MYNVIQKLKMRVIDTNQVAVSEYMGLAQTNE